MKELLNNAGIEADENRLFWFPFNVNEWLADRDVRLMTDYQRGWYIQLMVESWRDCGVLPHDASTLWKLAGAEDEDKFGHENGPVMAKFEPAKLDGNPVLVHRRLANLYIKQDKTYQQRCEAARISAAKRQQEKEKEEERLATERAKDAERATTVQ